MNKLKSFTRALTLRRQLIKHSYHKYRPRAKLALALTFSALLLGFTRLQSVRRQYRIRKLISQFQGA